MPEGRRRYARSGRRGRISGKLLAKASAIRLIGPKRFQPHSAAITTARSGCSPICTPAAGAGRSDPDASTGRPPPRRWTAACSPFGIHIEPIFGLVSMSTSSRKPAVSSAGRPARRRGSASLWTTTTTDAQDAGVDHDARQPFRLTRGRKWTESGLWPIC